MLLKSKLYFQAMTIKNLLAPNKNSIWPAFFWTFLILFFCFKSPSGEDYFYFPNVDKVVHFTFYFVFVVLWFRVLFFKQKTDFKTKVILVFIAIVLGIAVEIGQHFLTTTRQADVWDAVANSIGSVIGILAVSFLFKIKNVE
jgi:VanZ family protein